MSYRNPKQVVDTQPNKGFADLQKTIAGSFKSYANSVKIADAKKQKERELIQERENKRINDIIEDKNKNIGKAIAQDSEYSTIDFSGAKAFITDSADIQINNRILTPSQNNLVNNTNQIGPITRASTETVVADQTTFIDAYGKAPGTMGSIASGQELGDYENFYGLGKNGAKTRAVYSRDSSNNISISYETTSKNGVKQWSKNNSLPDIIINWQPSVDTFVEQGLKNEAHNFNDPNNAIFKGGKVIYNKNGKPEGILPNREVYEASIYDGVRANIIEGQSARDAINIYNDVFRRGADEIPMTTEWKVYKESDNSPEAIQQREYKDLIANAATRFVSNQADILKKPYKYRGSDAVPEAPEQEQGKDLYQKMRQNPVGLYQEYNKIAPGYDREAGTITIYSKDVEGEDSGNIVYNMENDAERNEFYLKLLKSSEAAGGTSKESKAFRKDFEEAMRADTSNRSKNRKEKSNKANSGTGPLNEEGYGKVKAFDLINKYSKKK